MRQTVLICDDLVFMRAMLAEILQQIGYTVVGEAGTGIAAVEQYKALRPDLVTMDLVMPDMGGIDAVQAIMAFDPRARIIVCSGMGQEALVVSAIEAGARDFVVKPFQAADVWDAVKRVRPHDNISA